MRIIIVLLFSLSLASVASAQQNPDPDFLRNALTAMQTQRNRAMDEAASAEAQLAKAQQQIADLQKQLDAMQSKENK